MNNKNSNIIILFFIALGVIAGILVYPYLPDQVVSDWNAEGQADGYMVKFWGIFLLPMVMVGMFLLYLVIPEIDPLKKNIESFRKYYNAFWIFIFVFFLYIFLLTVAWNLGYRFNFTVFLVPAVAVLWYFIGTMLEKSKRNWFVGIRTPWTLSNDEVWEKTHKLGGKLFKVSAFLSLVGLLFQDSAFAIWFILIPTIATAAITVVYSYLAFRKTNLPK